MIRFFSKYHVKKTDKEYTLPNGKVFPQTAIVSLHKETGDIISTLELGVIDADYLYKQILDKQAIHLDKCYIENFSLADIREKQNLTKHQRLDINGFSFTNSVFDVDGQIDLSFARFSTEELDFSRSIFLNSPLNFNHSELGDSELRFDNTYFHQGGVIFSNADFGQGLLSFKNAKFHDGKKKTALESKKKELRKKRFKPILDFEAASFKAGKIDFTRSKLGSGDLNFSNATLQNRDLLFVSADFDTVRLNFRSFNFYNGKLNFRFANFKHGELFFDRAEFDKGIIDFSATEFDSGKINFNRTEFERNELIFESSEFENGKIIFKNNFFGAGSINFKSAQYHSTDILFENTDFGNFTATFLRARINRLSFVSCHLNGYFNLQVRYCKALDFSNTVIRDIVDMKPFGFKQDIHLLNMSGLLLLGHLYIDWKSNKVKDLILNQETSHRNRSEQFRILKENYHALGRYSSEDEAYVEFRRSEAKADLEDAMASGSLIRKFKASVAHGFKWLIFDKIGLYATSPVRVMISMIVTYLFFVLIYYFLPFFVDSGILPSLDHGDNLSQLGVAFYHSVITFLTIGYGDFYPTGIFRWISGFEGFMGLFLISYFTVAFVRKVLR